MNLLTQALANLPKQTVAWFKFASNQTQPNGLVVSTFENAISVQGSWQPIARKDYQALGLDMQKQFVMFYTTATLTDESRGTTGDQVSYAGQRYSIVGRDGWQNVYGWDGLMLQSIGPS